MSPENANGNGLVEKAQYDDEALKHSVQRLPSGQGEFYSDAAASMFFLAQASDEIAGWGQSVKLRDKQLRDFISVEPMFASALGIVAARNSAFSWLIEGREQKTEDLQRILQQANFGKGWADFIAKISIDLSTQDSGAFFEIIRAGNKPDSDLVGIAHLDALRCYPTGVPEEPVVYLDRRSKYHRLKWYQVCQITEMPSTFEGLPGLQYCALTRMLRAARTNRDIGIYFSEKIGGRNARAITLVKGVTPQAISEAWAKAQFQNDSVGLMRFSQPVMVGSVDPKADIGFETLELASIPDGFDQDKMMQWYITQLAMAFLTDYQEFAPLSSGNLGTSTQSETLHMKSRGKGPGLFMKAIAEAMNFNVLPEEEEFKWDEQDSNADAQEAQTKELRGKGRAERIASGEITPQVARLIAVADGDLTEEQVKMLEKQDEESAKKEEEDKERESEQFSQRFGKGNEDTIVDDEGTPGSQNAPKDEQQTGEQQKTQDERAGNDETEDTRLEAEETFAKVMDNAFARALTRLQRHVGDHDRPA